MTLLINPVSNVFATGIRYDTGEDATAEEANCWIDGYDSGFAGKYDKDRARECRENREMYNYRWTWDIGCKDSTRTKAECSELINNPVEIEDFDALASQNSSNCYNAGRDDGEANKPFNEERENGCYEFDDIGGGYEGGYQFGCETHTAESTCELKYEDKQYYCPDHPDVVGCADFLLHNATYKMQGDVSIGGCVFENITCANETNPERYCLKYDDPFCRTIGDLCDEDGFVKPEYPYCK